MRYSEPVAMSGPGRAGLAGGLLEGLPDGAAVSIVISLAYWPGVEHVSHALK